MHKVTFELTYIEEWYEIIHELQKWFGDNWKGQRGVRKKFQKAMWNFQSHTVWFVVPDLAFKTFMDLKLSNPPNLR